MGRDPRQRNSMGRDPRQRNERPQRPHQATGWAGSTRRPLGHPIGSSYWVVPPDRPIWESHGGSHHIERTSVPESPPVFQCSRYDREGPGRHPPKISMTFLLVTSPRWRGQALEFENVLVAFRFNLRHQLDCFYLPPFRKSASNSSDMAFNSPAPWPLPRRDDQRSPLRCPG